MTAAYVATKMGEAWVTIWDFEWNSLTYERQLQVIADVTALTGSWNGPAAVKPPEAFPVQKYALSRPVRLYDGPLNGPLDIDVAGLQGISGIANAIDAIVRVVAPTGGGWLYAGPADSNPTVSTLDFNKGQVQDGFPFCLLTNGKLHLYATRPLVRVVVDVTSFYTA
jgi:hypothetical protein